MKTITAQSALEERAKYVSAFNDTMIKIWKEQITLLGVIDTHRLLNSPISVEARADGRFSELQLSQAFLEYGIWQDYGTGKEVPRGNSGDLGKPKVRKERHWFSRKYFVSYMNIIVFTCILKEPYIRHYGKFNDVYAQSLLSRKSGLIGL